MEAILFFTFFAVAVSLLGYFLRRTSSAAKMKLARKEKAALMAKMPRSEKLTTGGHNLLTSRDEVWRTRRQHVGLVSESADKTVGQRYFAYKPDAEPEYDGYSRADRHRVTPAHIKAEGNIEDIKVLR